MKTTPQTRQGFTIVELLIVVVVIAILAAVTIVGYNGISNRAKQSAAQTTAAQAQKKLAAVFIEAAETYPTSAQFESLTGLTSTGAVSYEYTVSADQKSYCLTTTNNAISYYTTHTSGTPALGGCAGHAINGISAITNYVLNPSIETNTANAQNIGNATGRSVNRTPVPDAYSGGHVLRINQPTAGISMGGYGILTPSMPTGQYVASLWVRSNQAIGIYMYMEGSAAKSPGSGGGTTLVPNTWTRLQLPFSITSAGTVKVGYLATTNAPVANTFVDLDGVMLTSGTATYTYADGSSQNWLWSGTDHGSTSLGVPLP